MYQLDNYVLYKGQEYARIFSLQDDKIGVESKNHILEIAPLRDISGISITRKTLTAIGLEPFKTEKLIYHDKLWYSIPVNGKMYHLHGHEYDNKGIWMFSGMSLTHIHHLQNIMTIIEPTHKFKLF